MSRTKRHKDPYQDNWKATTDRKPWGKPPSFFKKLMAAKRKAKEKQALRTMDDPDALIAPRFPKSDQWDWT